jgi:hypothetical protein
MTVDIYAFQLETHVYFVEAYAPPSTFYQYTPGTWVNFSGPDDIERPKRRGWVYKVEGTEAVVVDERTYKAVSDPTCIPG